MPFVEARVRGLHFTQSFPDVYEEIAVKVEVVENCRQAIANSQNLQHVCPRISAYTYEIPDTQTTPLKTSCTYSLHVCAARF